MPSSNVNDSALEIKDFYDHPSSIVHPALKQWYDQRRKSGGPFRPDFKMYTGHGSPEMTADRISLLQSLGAESLLLAWDLPTQLGLDPDHRLSRKQVGRAGVSTSSLDDMRTICSKIDLKQLKSIGTLANSLGPVGLALIIEVLDEAGASNTSIYLQNDPLKEFTARGTEIFEPHDSVRLACDVAEYVIKNEIPGHAITVCSNHYDIAGAGPIVALGLALANGVAYMDNLVSRGISPEHAARTISFFVNERSDFFITAALFRTTRELWADLLSNIYKVSPESVGPLHIMGYAHGLEAPEEPLVNVARVAVSIAAATLGGADTLCAAAYDEALRIPSDDAAALALRTIQVASSEHGMSDTIDPLNGSYKYEAICKEIYEGAMNTFNEVQGRGGAISCIENGFTLSMLAISQQHRHEQLKSGTRPWIGVNTLSRPDYRHLFLGSSQGDSRLRDEEAVLAVRATSRKNTFSQQTAPHLKEIEGIAATNENIVNAVRIALRSGATTEQIIASIRSGFKSRDSHRSQL